MTDTTPVVTIMVSTIDTNVHIVVFTRANVQTNCNSKIFQVIVKVEEQFKSYEGKAIGEPKSNITNFVLHVMSIVKSAIKKSILFCNS